MPRNNKIQFRKGSYAEWDTNNATVLASGEPGFVTNFNKLKIGDGSTQWADLTAVNDNLTTMVINKTASTIPKMSVVYINGAQGDTPSITLSLASGETTSSKTYGITINSIASNGIGQVVVDGALKNLDTLSQFDGVAPGTTLWLSPTVSGGITTTKPYAPYHMVSLGNLIRVHQTQGVINVRIQNGFELEELHNVAVTSATNGQFLQYNSGSELWIPSSSGNFTSLSINGTGVVSTSGGTSGYLSKFSNSNSNSINNSLIYDDGSKIGIGTSSPSYKLQVNGGFGATTKSFRIDHPSKKGHSLEYGSLESPYHGVRLTGRDKVIKGVGVVQLPSYLKDLIHNNDSLNIQITNIKHNKVIYVDKIDLNNDRFIVKAHRAKTLKDLEFFWTLTGVRKDVDELVVEKEN